MKSDDALGEYERIGVLVARKNELLSNVAHKGYEEHGRGAVFYCEGWEDTLPRATPFYLPASEPEFAGVGTDIQEAVAMYRPLSEGVVVVVTRDNDVFVARLRLPTFEEAFGSRMN